MPRAGRQISCRNFYSYPTFTRKVASLREDAETSAAVGGSTADCQVAHVAQQIRNKRVALDGSRKILTPSTILHKATGIRINVRRPYLVRTGTYTS